jgi:hypothetical protein
MGSSLTTPIIAFRAIRVGRIHSSANANVIRVGFSKFPVCFGSFRYAVGRRYYIQRKVRLIKPAFTS